MTKTELATWALTAWLKVHAEESWPEESNPDLARIRRLTGRSPIDFSDANVSAVSKALYALPEATLRGEYDRWRQVMHHAAETYTEHMDTVTNPGLPSPTPLGDLLAGIFGGAGKWVLIVGAALAGLLLLRR